MFHERKNMKSHSSLKNIPHYNKQKFRKEYDKDLLVRIKPTKILVDKEQLYQENLELKMKTHFLSEELLKVKTKILQLETEVLRKEDFQVKTGNELPRPKANLVQGLKQMIKELKTEKLYKEQEFFKLKSNLKGSKVSELEIEVKAYVDECTRLRHHLEEVIKSKQEPSFDQINFEQIINSLKKENLQVFNQLAQAKEENKTLSIALEEEKKKKKPVVRKIDVNNRSEVQKIKTKLEVSQKEHLEKEEKFKSEISGLKAKIESIAWKLKQKPQFSASFKPKAPKLFKLISDVILKKVKNIEDFVGILRKTKTIETMCDNVKIHCKAVCEKDFMEVVKYFNLADIEKIPDVLHEWYPMFDYSGVYDEKKTKKNQKTLEIHINSPKSPSFSKPENVLALSKQEKLTEPLLQAEINPIVPVSPNEAQELLLKLSLTLQIHRISQSDFSLSITSQEKIAQDKLEAILSKSPFNFPTAEAKILSIFLVEPSEVYYTKVTEGRLSEIQKKFEKNSKKWEIFTKEDISNLEIELQTLISKHKGELQEKFIAIDLDDDGIITFEEFSDIFSELKLETSEIFFSYCKLLFFSSCFKINAVPYVSFLQSYGYNDQSFSFNMTDEEITEVVKEVLVGIRDCLSASHKKVSEVFECDENRLISLKKVKKGIEVLGLAIPDEQISLFFDALQYEESEKPGLLLDEFEEILAHYSLIPSADENSIQISSEVLKNEAKTPENYSEDYESDYSAESIDL